MENSSDKENKSKAQFVEPKSEKPDSNLTDQSILNRSDDITLEDDSDEGWQEAVPKGRSPTSRKSSGSRRPSLAKLNTNFMNVPQSSRFRGKPSNFTSPRTSPNDSPASTGPTLPVPKRFVKSVSFSPKVNNSGASAGGAEKSNNPKSAPASPSLTDQVTKSASVATPISVQAAGKLFSYKEVALAPPGTIVKAVAEQLPKGNLPTEPSPQVSHEAAATEINFGEVTALKDAEEEKDQKTEGEKQLPVSEEMESPVNEEKETEEGNSCVTERLEETKSADVDHKETEAAIVETETATVEVAKAEAGNVAVLEHENFNTSKDSNNISSKTQVLDTRVSESCPALTENAALLLEKDASSPNKKVGNENIQDLSNGDMSVKPLPTEGEKQDEAETGKETTKKLSAAAPPFNPSTVPVFGSVTVPGFKDHGGILPPPVNIPPILTINPVRRSPHQSATARVPYGPRLSGGYNRSGNRVPRNKPSFHNGEHTGDVNQFSPPRIMNPHAAEFVPGQPWVPNGYPVLPNGYLAATNGMPVSPNSFPISPTGIPVSPNGYPASLNGIQVTQNGFPVSPVGSGEPTTLVTVDFVADNKSETAVENGTENSSIEVGVEGQPSEQKLHEDQDENAHPVTGEKPKNVVPVTDDAAVPKEICNSIPIEEKPSKCWADYSDSESEIVEVTS